VSALLTLRNRAPWGAWGVSVDCGRGNNDTGPDDDLRTGLAYAPGCCSTETTFDFIPRCRGSYPRGTPRIVCGFPFGLWSATRPLVVGTPVLVWPQTFAVGPIPDVRVGHSDEGLSNRDRAGDWGDPLGFRRYRRGDRFRHIHWTQTAQRGELMVCEVQASAAPRILIVLDSRPEVHSGRGPSSSLEWGAVAPVRDAGNHHSLWVPKSRAGTGSRARRAFVRTNEAGSMRTSPHRFLAGSRWLAWWHSASSAVSHNPSAPAPLTVWPHRLDDGRIGKPSVA